MDNQQCCCRAVRVCQLLTQRMELKNERRENLCAGATSRHREVDPAGVVMIQLQGDNCNLQISRNVAAKEGMEIFYGRREFKGSMAELPV